MPFWRPDLLWFDESCVSRSEGLKQIGFLWSHFKIKWQTGCATWIVRQLPVLLQPTGNQPLVNSCQMEQWQTVRVVGINQIRFLCRINFLVRVVSPTVRKPLKWFLHLEKDFGSFHLVSSHFLRVPKETAVWCRWHGSLQPGLKVLPPIYLRVSFQIWWACTSLVKETYLE